jgi:hypothetical protein
VWLLAFTARLVSRSCRALGQSAGVEPLQRSPAAGVGAGRGATAARRSGMREKASRRTRQNVRVNFAFTVRGDGIIEAHAGSGDGLLDHARNDALSSRAPRGASSEGLSTYWIDRTEEALRRAIAEGHEKPFASGNATYLRLDGDHVVAAYDFDPDEREGELLPLGEFLSLLNEWRRRVVEAGGVSGQAAARMSEERKPYPMGPPA